MIAIKDISQKFAFPKNYIAELILKDLGADLVAELDDAGCELIIKDSLIEFKFTNITPELQGRVNARVSYK